MGVIDTQMIPEHIIVFEAAKILPGIEDFFRNPKHQKEFEQWQQARRKEKNEKDKTVCSNCFDVVAGGGKVAARA